MSLGRLCSNQYRPANLVISQRQKITHSSLKTHRSGKHFHEMPRLINKELFAIFDFFCQTVQSQYELQKRETLMKLEAGDGSPTAAVQSMT